MQRMAFLSILLTSIALPALAEISPVRLDVERRSNSKGGPTAAGQPPAQKTQTQSLVIKLFNTSKESLTDLTVRYWFFGRDTKGQNATVFKQGESKVMLDKGERKSVETETVTSNYAEAGTKFTPAGPNRAPTAERVPATGQKLVGYAVQVLNGAKVISEYYSEASYKQKIAGPPPAK